MLDPDIYWTLHLEEKWIKRKQLTQISRCFVQMSKGLKIYIVFIFSKMYFFLSFTKLLISKCYLVDIGQFHFMQYFHTLHFDFLGRKMWFRETKCPRVLVLKYVIPFNGRKDRRELPHHIILIINHQEKFSHCPQRCNLWKQNYLRVESFYFKKA